MSSFKKVARSRGQYKERSQPAGRKKLGLLEKHKDYVLRAKDYHAKEKRLRSLREKAALRNPDEFYFAMQNAKTEVAYPLCSKKYRRRKKNPIESYYNQDVFLMKLSCFPYKNRMEPTFSKRKHKRYQKIWLI